MGIINTVTKVENNCECSKSDFFERLLAKARCRTEKAIQRNREVEKSEIIKKIPSRRVWREGLSYDDYKFKSKIISE